MSIDFSLLVIPVKRYCFIKNGFILRTYALLFYCELFGGLKKFTLDGIVLQTSSRKRNVLGLHCKRTIRIIHQLFFYICSYYA